MPTITVTIEQGTATVDAQGFTGTTCVTETAKLQQLLGETAKDTKRAEYHRPVKASHGVKQ